MEDITDLKLTLKRQLKLPNKLVNVKGRTRVLYIVTRVSIVDVDVDEEGLRNLWCTR